MECCHKLCHVIMIHCHVIMIHCHVIMIHCRRWFALSVHRTIDTMMRLHVLSFGMSAVPVRNIKGVMVASDVQKGLFRQPCGLLEAF